MCARVFVCTQKKVKYLLTIMLILIKLLIFAALNKKRYEL